VELRPFPGIVYNPAHIDNLFALLAPPYDVISAQEQEMYYQRHEHNVVRLSYGKDEPGDSARDNRYTRAARYLQTWLQGGILLRDPQPAMYLCAEDYVLPDGTQRQRQGLIALCRLEPYERGIVMPHEATSPVPKRMLFDLRSTVEANLCQIFALYTDDTGKLQEMFAAQRRQPARLSFRDQDQMLHRVWTIDEPTLLQEIGQAMAASWALIADGHHRYETCLEYQQMRRRANPHASGDEWFNFVMMYLTEVHDPGLTILPTHRVLQGLAPTLVQQLPTCLAAACELEALPFQTPAEREAQRLRLQCEMRSRGASSHVFGLYTGGDRLWLLTYRGSPATPTPTTASDDNGAALDVSLLHDVLLEKVLGLCVREEAIAFTQDDRAALDLVAGQEYQVAFLLNPTRVEQVVQHAIAGKRMPRKSTYFYPKLLTGIVMHKEVGDADHLG
jgi:uncharacterized protein (DUF1015 family)